MKGIKIFLSYILIISVLLSSAVPVFAGKYLDSYEFIEDIFKYDVGGFVSDGKDSIEEEDDETARTIAFLDLLGIISKSDFENRNSLITMTEFSVIMSRVRLGVPNALENVYPIESNLNNKNVTYKEVYSYLIDALGYKYRLSEYDDSERAALIVAADIGLINDNPKNINEYVTREVLALLIRKALEIDICIMEFTDRGYRYEVMEDKNLLNTVHNLHDVSGFVNAIEGLSVYGGEKVREGFIQIDRRNLRISGINDSEYFGKVVNAYAKYDESTGEYTIVAINCDEDAKSFEIDFKDILDIKNGDIYYNDAEGNEQTQSLSEIIRIVENGVMISSFDAMCDYRNNEGKIVLTPSSENGEIDTAIIYQYNYFMTSYNDTREMRIGLSFKQTYRGNRYIQLNEKAPVKVKINDAISDYEMIKAGSAVRVFQCPATGYTELVVSTSATSGEVVSTYEDFITVADVEMRISTDLKAHIEDCKTNIAITGSDNIKYPEIGMIGAFYQIDGVLAGYVSEIAYSYGYLRTGSIGRSSINPTLTLRIFGQDGKWYDFEVGEKLEFDGKKGVTRERVVNAVKSNPAVLGSVVRFKATSNGRLLALDTIMESDVEAGMTDDIKYIKTYVGLAQWTSEWLGSSEYTYSLTSDSILFYVPEDDKDDEEKITIMKNTQLNNSYGEPDWTMEIYNCNDFNQIELGLITDHPDASAGNDSIFFYVESMSRVVIDEDDMTYGYRVTGKQLMPSMSVGSSSIKDAKYYIEDDVRDKNSSLGGYNPNLKMEIGDLVGISVKSGEIDTWRMELKGGRVDPNNLGYMDNGTNYNSTDSARQYFCGIVEKVDTERDYALININGLKVTPKIRCKIHIDTYTNKMTNLKMDGIHEGDIVFGFWKYGNVDYLIKN